MVTLRTRHDPVEQCRDLRFEQYSDFGLADLLPLACDGGSRDFAIDLAGRNGRPVGTILLNDRGTMTVIELVELARAGSRWPGRP